MEQYIRVLQNILSLTQKEKLIFIRTKYTSETLYNKLK